MKDSPEFVTDLKIIVENDDRSPFEGVVALLRRCLGYGEEQARNVARHIDRHGQVELGPWVAPVAQAMLDQIQGLAAQYGCASLPVRLETEVSTKRHGTQPKFAMKVRALLAEHFEGWESSELSVIKREFPAYLRVDVQRAVEGLTADARRVGVHSRFRYDNADLASMISEREREKCVGAMEYEDFDIGEEQPVRLPINCLSLLHRDDLALAVWVHAPNEHESPMLSVELACPPGEQGERWSAGFLQTIESQVALGRSYRGKILSLEASETYRGLSPGALSVHFATPVDASELILPDQVRHALQAHVVDFAAHRDDLKRLGQSLRKGVLLYGPPGTGKTHTVRYLAHRLTDHTTFLVTAEQVGLISVYFRLARLFAPALVVIEDADLIGRQRENLGSSCDEAMLNRLLNEMDGLRRDAEITVLMTTNRPDTLELALVQRPGRVDHAIEVPLPDADCRKRLFALYGRGLLLDTGQINDLVARTEGVSAAFIKELCRRLALESIRDGHAGRVSDENLRAVIGEILSERDGINLRLLGGLAQKED